MPRFCPVLGEDSVRSAPEICSANASNPIGVRVVLISLHQVKLHCARNLGQNLLAILGNRMKTERL